MPYIVNTSFHIVENIEPEFVEWVRKEYIPSALNQEFFTSPLFCRLLVQVEEGTISYAVHFRTDNIEAAKKWFEGEGAVLKQKFPADRMLHFTTFMEEIETIS